MEGLPLVEGLPGELGEGDEGDDGLDDGEDGCDGCCDGGIGGAFVGEEGDEGGLGGLGDDWGGGVFAVSQDTSTKADSPSSRVGSMQCFFSFCRWRRFTTFSPPGPRICQRT